MLIRFVWIYIKTVHALFRTWDILRQISAFIIQSSKNVSNLFINAWDCRMRGLKDFRKTLLLAHEKAFTYMKLQETSCNDLPADRSVGSNNNDVSDFVCVNTSKPFDAAAVADHETGCGSPQVKRMVSGDISNREDQESTASVLSKEWTCSTCVDAKFTSKCLGSACWRQSWAKTRVTMYISESFRLFLDM